MMAMAIARAGSELVFGWTDIQDGSMSEPFNELTVTLHATGRPPDGGEHPTLLLWEAYVWGAARCRETNAAGLRPDVQDAATAVRAFLEWESSDPRHPSGVTADDPISTAGAAVLWSGLSTDLGLLHQSTLVLRPATPMGADVKPFRP